MSSRDSGTITNRFYVENWVYKGGVKIFHVRCLPPLYIYKRPLFTSLYNIGRQTADTKNSNFNLIYTKFYADFRSGLRFGCYQRTISSYVIYLALSATLPSSVAFFLDRTSKVTTPHASGSSYFLMGLSSVQAPIPIFQRIGGGSTWLSDAGA